MSFDIIKVNEVFPEVGAQMIEPMKIWKLPAGKESMLSEICQSGNYFLEEKIDGAFYQFVKTENYEYLFGRTVSVKNGLLTEKGANVPHILKALNALPKNTIIIGEIYYPGCTSKDVVSIMGCLPELAIKRQENNPIHYYLHDIIEYDGVNLINLGAEDRYKILVGVWNKHNLSQYNFLRLALKINDNLEEEISRILNSGGEGAVLKKKDYPYTPGKRPAWSTVKIKQMDSIDLVCTGLCDATRDYTGKELESWEYWEIGYPTFYDCFEEDHCFAGWKWEKQEGKFFKEYNFQQKFHPNLLLARDGIGDNDKVYRPVTKPYFLGWKTAIKIGAYDLDKNLIDLGTVASGLTDDNKKEMTYFPEKWVEKVISLDCMSINKKDHTLRHPVFKCIRDDKSANDCLISEIFS